MAKRVYNPFLGKVETDAQRVELQTENYTLYQQREISKAEYERAFAQINAAYAAALTRQEKQQ